MKSLLILALLVAAPAKAANPAPEGSVYDSVVGRITHFIDGYLRMGNTGTPPVTITLDGPNGEGVFIGSVTATNITTDESNLFKVAASTTSLSVSTAAIKATQTADEATISDLGVSTRVLASGGATTYLKVDGSNPMSALVVTDGIVIGAGNQATGDSLACGDSGLTQAYLRSIASGHLSYATTDSIASGYTCTASLYGTAFGYKATATSGNTFVWNGDQSNPLSDSGPDTFVVQAPNGYFFKEGAVTLSSYLSELSYITAVSSVNASAFFGDGSHLTGIIGETNTYTSSKTITSDFEAVGNIYVGSHSLGNIYGLYTSTVSSFKGDDVRILGVKNVSQGGNVILSPASGKTTKLIGNTAFENSSGLQTASFTDSLFTIGNPGGLSVTYGVVASSFSGGAIDTADVNLATVTTALAGKASTFVGITSSCASGYYLSTATYANGIVTGGLCALAGTGSGGGSSTMTITAVSDNFLGQVTGSLKTFTLSNTPANAAALQCHLDGLLLSQTSDYTYTAPSTIALTTAPAANSTGFECDYFVNTSTLPAAFILNSSQTVSGATIFQSSVTLGPVVMNSTANYSALTVNAEWSLISSTHPAGSSSFWFYNIISTAPSACKSHPRYKVDFDLVAGSASGEYLLQFGATGNSDVDKTTNYHGSMTGNANAGSLILNGWQDSGCLLTYQSSTLAVRNGFPWQGAFEFSPMIGNDNFVYGGMLTDGNYGNDLANRGAILINSCTWPFSSRIGPLSFMKFSTTNGTTVTGDVSLWMRCTQ